MSVPRLCHIGLRRNILSCSEFLNDLSAIRSLQRVALEVCIDVAIENHLQTCLAGIKGDDDNVTVNTVGNAGCLHGINSTECLVIVLANNDVELSFIGFAVGLHNLLAAVLCEITGLLIQFVPSLRLYILIESLRTSDLSGRSCCTGDNQDVQVFDALCLCVCLQPCTCCKTLVLGLGSDPCGVFVGVINRTVDNDNRDISILSLCQNGVPSCGNDRVDDDVINLLLDEVSYGLELCLGVVIAVYKLQIEAILL